MTTYQANMVSVFADYDYGEGCLTFEWPDRLLGHEGLSIDYEGFCSRHRQFYSGNGPPQIDLQRDHVKLRFTPRLAKCLELEEEIEIRFELADGEFDEVRRFVDFLNGEEIDDVKQ